MFGVNSPCASKSWSVGESALLASIWLYPTVTCITPLEERDPHETKFPCQVVEGPEVKKPRGSTRTREPFQLLLDLILDQEVVPASGIVLH
jgi:hypothetical protein